MDTDHTPASKRFIVLTRSRSGSNLLISLLQSHPNIRANGEILWKLNGRDHSEILTQAFSQIRPQVKASGFKIFYYHPTDDDTRQVWDSLVNMTDLHVIHLKRENILKTLVSRKVAANKKVWSTKTPDAGAEHENEKFHFFMSELKKGFLQTQAWEQEADELFKDHPMLTITYESLAKDREPVFRQIMDFLELDYHAPESPLKKQNNRSLSDVISNYSELKKVFTGTPWEPFFED